MAASVPGIRMPSSRDSGARGKWFCSTAAQQLTSGDGSGLGARIGHQKGTFPNVVWNAACLLIGFTSSRGWRAVRGSFSRLGLRPAQCSGAAAVCLAGGGADVWLSPVVNAFSAL